MPRDEELSSPHEIERRIERERSELSATLDEIQNRFTPDAMIGEVTRAIRANGEDVGRAIGRSVKENPVALAVTGIGLAWLIFGNNSKTVTKTKTVTRVEEEDYALPARPARPASERYRAAAYSPAATPASAAGRPTDDRAAHYPSWYSADEELDDFDELDEYDATGEFSEFRHAHQAVVAEDEASHSGGVKDAAHRAGGAASDAAHRAGGAASGAAHRAGAAASGAAHRVGDAAHDAGESVRDGAHGLRNRLRAGAADARNSARRARWRVSDALHSGSDSAKRLRARLAEGTDDLSHEARERIIAARARALDVRRQAEVSARHGLERGREAAIRGKDAAVDFFEEQPLVAGALAVAVGAAIAGALPRSRKEDEWFGDTSDHLRDEAERIFREERAKAERVARAAMDEANDVLHEEGRKADHAAKEAFESAKDEAKSAAQRVEDRVKTEAEKEKLGQPDV
ncbi:DUF3619 family protein [Pseudoroseicyclus sp. H15]